MKQNKIGYIYISDDLYIKEYEVVKKIFNTSIPIRIEYIRHLNKWKIYLINETFEEVNEGFEPRQYTFILKTDGIVFICV